TTVRPSADHRGATSKRQGGKRAMKLKATMAYGLAAAALMIATAAATGPAAAEDVTLKMAVPDWPPTHIMKDLFDKTYKPKSGNKVTLDEQILHDVGRQIG